jgi:hypothetical protein
VEIKCQLDATDDFYADLITYSTCFGHHYAHHQELESIIQVAVACGIWCFGFKLSVWCGAESYVSSLWVAALLKLSTAGLDGSFQPIQTSGRQQESMTIPKAAHTVYKLLMMGGKTARNM